MSGDRVRSGPVAVGVAAIVALASFGCATPHVFQRYVEAGLYEDATRTFESDSTLWSRPEVLLLAGRMFSDPSLPVFDPERARRALERLATGFPGSDEAAQADLLLSLLTQLEKLGQAEKELSARAAELETRAARADTLAASQTEAAERELDALRRRIERLEAELEQARQELERLKAIDLRRRPPNRR
jgi:hypothetical protein